MIDAQVSDIALNIMKRRVLYIKENGEQERPIDAYIRTANFVASSHNKFSSTQETENFKDKAIDMMASGKFMPNTPTLVNAGFPNAQCSACFVFPVDDNLPSIYKAHYDQGLTHASGGGTGFFLGDIRSAGTKAAGRFITKGPINWLRMLNENAIHVAQGMRDGANMAILDVSHPDILEFIKCKRHGYNITPELLIEQFNIDLEEAHRMKAIIGIEKVNISISISKAFMVALENDNNWNLVDPHTKQVVTSIPAYKIWNEIVQNAWEHGEPGLFFEDTVNDYNMLLHKGRIRATNPCVTGDTLIQTDRGLERMAIFVDEARSDSRVLGKNGQWRGVKKFMNNGIKPVWKITTRSGYSIKATEYHKFLVKDKGEIQLKEINIDDVLFLNNNSNYCSVRLGDGLFFADEFELLGWIVGNGYLSDQTKTHKSGLIVGNKDKNLLPKFIRWIEIFTGAKCKPYERPEYNTIQLISRKIWDWAINKMKAYPVKSEYKRVPESVWTASKESITAFIRGLFSADGHVKIDKKGSAIVLTSRSLGLIQDIQILFSMFGCRTTIVNKSRPIRNEIFKYTTINGNIKYNSFDGKYELFLYGKAKLLFRNYIGFTNDSYKQEELNLIPIENNNPYVRSEDILGANNSYNGLEDKDHVISIEYVGEEEVFDITVDDEDLSMINNGIVTIDCGEQPRRPYESCNLGHANLSKFVIGVNGSSSIDWSGLEEVLRFGVQFLDNIVEINTFPIKELDLMNRAVRNIGLGIMGWADMLAKLGIPYDSDEAINKADEVGKFIRKVAEDETAKLGQDRGNFPYFEGSEFEKAGLRYRRNNDITTIAPTGQTSMYANCSSSIEPITFPVIVRNQGGLIQVEYHPILFKMLEDRGLNTQEVRDKLGELGSVRKADFLPDDIKSIFPSSHDVSYQWHVEHQMTWQRYTTSGVSKTINFPNKTTKEDIDSAFKMAYHGRCKGITVYRDGTRLNQPLSIKKKKEQKPIEIKTNKRDSVTFGTNRKVKNGCGNLMIYVGNSGNGKIQEITARLGKGGGCASAQTEAIARVASIAIQHGVEPAYISEQLGGIRCHLTGLHQSAYTGERPRIVTSCADAISVAISEHIANGTDEARYAKQDNHVGACPECGGQLSFEETCVKCYNCGFSRC